jgi:hypothetical protein
MNSKTVDWITMQNIKMDFASTDSSVNPNTTSIMSPCFLSQNDISAGAGNSNQLFWKGGDWFSGDFADGPNQNDKISSFDVLDTLINHYTNASMYPNMQVRHHFSRVLLIFTDGHLFMILGCRARRTLRCWPNLSTLRRIADTDC